LKSHGGTVPALPLITQHRPDQSCRDIVEIQREVFLFPGENPTVARNALPMVNEDFLKEGNYRHWCDALFSFRVMHMGTPNGSAHVQRIAREVLAGRGILRNYGRNNNFPETGRDLAHDARANKLDHYRQ
jgi:hypothetical protein